MWRAVPIEQESGAFVFVGGSLDVEGAQVCRGKPQRVVAVDGFVRLDEQEPRGGCDRGAGDPLLTGDPPEEQRTDAHGWDRLRADPRDGVRVEHGVTVQVHDGSLARGGDTSPAPLSANVAPSSQGDDANGRRMRCQTEQRSSVRSTG